MWLEGGAIVVVGVKRVELVDVVVERVNNAGGDKERDAPMTLVTRAPGFAL